LRNVDKKTYLTLTGSFCKKSHSTSRHQKKKFRNNFCYGSFNNPTWTAPYKSVVLW